MESIWNLPQVRKLISLAIEEDLLAGDITSQLTLDPGSNFSARIIARENLRICGIGVIETTFQLLNAPVEVVKKVSDGDDLDAGQVVAVLSGEGLSLLAAERLVLNFMQHLSGVATRCRQVRREAKGLSVLDTRKTTPGWRVLEKYAVRVGGCANHRFGLGDMILVKDNHIDANKGDIKLVLDKVFNKKPPYVPVEVEVRNFSELEIALNYPCTVIMLDNFSDAEIKKALTLLKANVKQSAKQPLIEASGGIKVERLPLLADLGVGFVSMGSLTNSVLPVDLAMDFELQDF